MIFTKRSVHGLASAGAILAFSLVGSLPITAPPSFLATGQPPMPVSQLRHLPTHSRQPPVLFTQYGGTATHNPIMAGAVGTWQSPPLRGQDIFEASYDPRFHVILTDTMTMSRGWLYALNAQTGHVLWRWHAPNLLMATPILNPSGTMVYIGWGNGAFSNATPHSIDNAFLVRGSGSSGVVALNVQTGHVVWQHLTHGAVMPSLTYYRGAVYVGTGNRHFDGWNAITGKPILHQWIAGFDSMGATPVTSSGVAIVPAMAPASIWGIAVPSGSIRWVVANPVWTGGITDTNPLIHGQFVWLSTLTMPITVPSVPLGAIVTADAIAINVNTGRVVYQIPLGQGPRPIHTETGNYTLADHRLYLTSPVTDTVYALDPNTGRILWMYKANAPVRAGVLVWRGHCYVPAGNTIWILNAATGVVEGSAQFGASVQFSIDSPIMVGRHLIIPLPRRHISTVVSLPVQANGLLGNP